MTHPACMRFRLTLSGPVTELSVFRRSIAQRGPAGSHVPETGTSLGYGACKNPGIG